MADRPTYEYDCATGHENVTRGPIDRCLVAFCPTPYELRAKGTNAQDENRRLKVLARARAEKEMAG